jgi:hypothetical protein
MFPREKWRTPSRFARCQKNKPALYFPVKVAHQPVGCEGTRELANKRMAPQVGLEPTTLRLTAGCSAIELLRSGSTLTCALELSTKSYQRLRPMGNSLVSTLGLLGSCDGVSVKLRFC